MMSQYCIETKNLTKAFGKNIVVNNLNLNIKHNQLFALLGINGAGKSTTIKMLSTLLKPTSGTIIVDGKNINANHKEIRKDINISPQETALSLNLSVMDNLDFIAGVYSVKNKKEKIDEIIKKFKFEPILKTIVKKLSGGWKRKLSIALSLINDPKILFLDEPTLGLDVISRKELWNLIKELKKNKTIILTTHYMEEVVELADDVAIISNGKLLANGTVKEIIDKTQTKTFEDAFVKLTTKGEK